MRRRDLHLDNPRKFGNAREDALVKGGGFRRTPNSGASSVKGDLRRSDFMVEMKATRAGSFSVTDEIMSKLRNDQLTNGKRGVLIVELGNGRKYAVMPFDTFEELVPDGDQV